MERFDAKKAAKEYIAGLIDKMKEQKRGRSLREVYESDMCPDGIWYKICKKYWLKCHEQNNCIREFRLREEICNSPELVAMLEVTESLLENAEKQEFRRNITKLAEKLVDLMEFYNESKKEDPMLYYQKNKDVLIDDLNSFAESDELDGFFPADSPLYLRKIVEDKRFDREVRVEILKRSVMNSENTILFGSGLENNANDNDMNDDDSDNEYCELTKDALGHILSSQKQPDLEDDEDKDKD